MKLLRNQKESVRHIFDSYCKKILRQENAGMKRSEVRRRAREYSLSELPPELLEKLRYEDVHPMVFEVCGSLSMMTVLRRHWLPSCGRNEM